MTMTGTAEMIAEDIQTSNSAHEWSLVLAEHADASVLSTRNLIVVSSTYGNGEVPDPGKPLFEAVSASKPNLSGVRYGVISLGDSGYKDTFANGGRLWDTLLQSCGASRLEETLVLDASEGGNMSEVALSWSAQWLSRIAEVEFGSLGSADEENVLKLNSENL